MTGLETAEYLVDTGNKVAIVEMADEIAPGTWIQHKMDVIPKLEENGTEFYPSWKLTEMREDSVEVQNTEIPERFKNIPCDAIIMSLGVRPAGLSEDIKKIATTIDVGDAIKSGRIANATHTAYRAAMALK